MKRWAVFDCRPYDSSGGMEDFLGAFNSKEEAELFIIRQIDRSYLVVEDMEEYLDKESPHIPTPEEFNKAFQEGRK